MRAILRTHCKGHHSKPWNLQPNGDLKHMLFKFLRAKGPNSVAFNKVKGHATAEDVQNSTATEQDKEGNDHADAAAKAGLHLIRPCLVNVAHWTAIRHQRYSAFMVQIHKIIIHIYFADSDKRNTISTDGTSTTSAPSLVTVPTRLTYGNAAQVVVSH